VTLFCAEAEPDPSADPRCSRPLSQRWQRVAIQQAAGSARSWRAHQQRAPEDCADPRAAWREEDQAPGKTPPKWREGQTPTLKRTVIQATATVALLQPAPDSACDDWRRVST
jgi:hypothetical protein